MGQLKNTFCLFVLSCLVANYACSPRRSEPISGKTIQRNAAIENGMKVYMIHCQKCHPNGEAGLGPAINNKPIPGFIKRFQVRHGLGVMPAFKKEEIATKDLKDLTTYMKALKRRK